VRFTVAGAVLAVVWMLVHRRVPRLTLGQWRSVVFVGVLVIGGMGCLTIGEQTVPSGLAALLVATTPAWVVLLRAVYRQSVARLTWLGVVIGLSGVGLLTVSSGVGTSIAVVGFLLVLSAALGDAAGSFYAQRVIVGVDPLLSSALQMVAVGPMLLLGGVFRGEAFDPSAWGSAGITALLYLIGPGSIIAYTAFVWLISRTPPSIATTYTYVNPVVAVILGWMVLGERLTPLALIAAGIVVASVAAITMGERSAPAATRVRGSSH
jgi:drug/metabolite transporter (DMT)-like permease